MLSLLRLAGPAAGTWPAGCEAAGGATTGGSAGRATAGGSAGRAEAPRGARCVLLGPPPP
eukprot:9544484-Lingulodinium_polyedra.AAC.1